jgi:hypothetical protein
MPIESDEINSIDKNISHEKLQTLFLKVDLINEK